MYWESKRKLDELNERLRLAKKEGDSAPVLVHATEDAASVIQETAMPAQITPTPNLETNSIANTAGSQTASIARTTDHILEITPNKPVTKSEAVIAIDSVINQPTMSLSPEHGSIVGETPSTDFKILPQEINATNYLIVNQEVQEIGESMELLKKLADPAEDTEDLISEDLRGFAVAAKQPLNLPIPDIKSSTEISKITANALGSGNNELKDIDHEIIYEPDFEDIDSSTASASNILEISDLNKSGEESVKVGTAEKFVFNVIDNLDPQSSAALTTATEFSKSFTTSSNDIDLSIKMIPTNLVEALTESIFSDLLKDSLDLAVTMTQPLLLKSESLPLASNPAVAKLPVSSLVSNNSVITSPFSSFIPPVIELDYNTILANGCAYVIQLLSEILPEGSTYWEPPLIKAINELPALLEPVRDLLIDVANEAIFDQFEKHRFYDDPRTKLYQRRTIKPAKVSKEALINGCSTKFRMWRMHSIKHGTNLDALLIETVKSEGKILCNILNDEILVKKRIFEEIWNDLIEDTAHCALDANLI